MHHLRRGGNGLGIFALALLTLCPATAVASVFYVRVGGSDAADGQTPATAFATIGYAAAAVSNPGDTVIVGPGTYAEGNLGPVRGGTPGHPTTFLADPTGVATGDAPGAVVVNPALSQATPAPTTGFLLMGVHDVVIDGFTVVNASDAGIQVRSAADGSVNSSSITIRDTVVRSSTKRGIDVYAAGDVLIQHNVAIANGSTGVAVAGCVAASPLCRVAATATVTPTIADNTTGMNGADGIFVTAASGGVVQDNVSFSNGATGATVRSATAVMLLNNLIYANQADGIGLGTADAAAPGFVVADNTVYGNGQGSAGGWGLVVGTNTTASPDGLVLDNIFQHNGLGGIAVARSSTCGYVAGFNVDPDGYGPKTPHNSYDLNADPLLVDPAGPDGVLGGAGYADDDFHLAQSRGGQSAMSPAVDAGFAPAAAVGVTGSTAETGVPDIGVADIGYHYGATPQTQITAFAPYMPLFVRPDGNDQNDGLDPSRAVLTIVEAARRARAGVTVVVGPGQYTEGDIHPLQNGGVVSFFADSTASATGELPGPVLVDANGKDTGFVLLHNCEVTVDGFSVTNAAQAAIQVRAGADDAHVRNNVAFSNQLRGIEVFQANAAEIRNNLVYANGSGGIHVDASQGSVVINNTVYGNGQDGVLVGGTGGGTTSDAAPDTTLTHNIVADNLAVGIKVQTDSFAGYVTGFNVASGPSSFAGNTPRADSDYIADPLFVDPAGPDGVLGGSGFSDDDFHLVQDGSTVSPAVDVDFSSQNAFAEGSTRSDGLPDLGPLDAGYHYPFLPRRPPTGGVPQVVFVRHAGDDSAAGDTPATAYASVTQALAAIGDGGLIVIGPGTYSGRDLRVGGTDTGAAYPVLLGDPSGTLTGDAPGQVELDAGGGAGLTLTGPVLLDGLSLTGALGAGLRVLHTAHDVVIRHSALCRNRGGGIAAAGDGLDLIDTLVCANGGAGANIRLFRAQRWTRILGNTIVANVRQGLVAREVGRQGSHLMLYGNVALGNGAIGLTLRVPPGGAVAEGGNFSSSGYGGVLPGAGDLPLAPFTLGPGVPASARVTASARR